MARRGRAKLAARLRSSADGMPASTQNCSTGVGCKYPVIVRKVQFRLTSVRWCACFCSMFTHSLRRLLTDSNDGFLQCSVLHACLNLMGGEACVLMKQVHKSFGWSSSWSSALGVSPCHQFWYYFPSLLLQCQANCSLLLLIRVVILGRSPYNVLLVIWSFQLTSSAFLSIRV